VFETTSPFDTPREMEALVAWTRKALDEEALHPLLLIAVFIVTFLAIHRFQDGNGRLSRVLTTLLLLRAGYAYVPYASLERVIEKTKTCTTRRSGIRYERQAADGPWCGMIPCLDAWRPALAAEP
jgi:Fic family protein